MGPAVTPAIYMALLSAFQSGKNERAAAEHAGCTRAVARSALTGLYASRYQWAPAIRDVISGAVPVPVMPRIWPPPTMPRIEPAPPPRLSVVRDPKPKPEAPADDIEPLPPPPARDSAQQAAIATTGNDGLDALAEYRVSLTQRARAMADAGYDVDRVVKWLTGALVKFAESMSQKGAVVSLGDLTAMASAVGMVAASMDKFGAALERAVAAERKLNPPQTGDDDGFAAAQAAARTAAARKRASG